MADPQNVETRTGREIAGHLSHARQAFVARNHEATLLACEKVLLLDPQNVAALDLLDLARTTAEEQRIETWLTQAREALDQKDIATAADLIDQALAVDPNLEPALALRKRMLALRRERDRGRERRPEPQSTPTTGIHVRASSGRSGPDLARSRSLPRTGAVAAGVILTAAIGIWAYRQMTQPARSSQHTAPSSQPAVTEPAPATPPTSSIPVEKPAAAAVPSPAATEAEQKVAQLRRDARDQFQRGQRRALDTVSEGLQAAPQDSELQAILDSILTDAQRITGRSKEAAVTAGASQYAKGPYQDALKLERDASQQIASGSKDAAARTLWRAEETFDRAERDARLERAQLKVLQDEQAKQRLARGGDKPGNQPAATGTSKDAPVPVASPSGGKPSAAVQPRSETPPGSATSPTASDLEKARVSGIVQRYAMGYSALNPTAVYAVYPGEAVWQFSEFDSYTLTLTDCVIGLSSDEASATAACTATHSFKRKRAAAMTEQVRQIFTLRRRGTGWIIVSIAYDRTPR